MSTEFKAEPETDDTLEICAFWKEQIKAFEETNSDWETRGENITSRYRDERNKISEQGQRRLNTLWANTEILMPAIYSQCPTPMIERRFLDRDPVGRMSAQILERSVRFELEDNGFHGAVKRAVKDFLLPGRGIVWVRYEPEFGRSVSLVPHAELDITDEDGNVIEGAEKDDEEGGKLEDTGEKLVSESVPVDYIYWKDFMFFPSHARTWSEVTAIGKRVYMSKDETEDRWGPEMADKIKADVAAEQESRRVTTKPSPLFDRNDRKRVIYEIWNKRNRKVYWLSTGYDHIIEMQDDPMQLRGFFPVPEPLMATWTNDTVIPIAFYIEYQDQAIQIDELTQRISMLSKCVKAAGTYDGSNRALRRLLDESTENELIGVDDWARHREKGGIEGSISFLPIREMVEALQVLVELRAKIMEDLDRVTGIADILRGTTDARETLGGQRLKQNSANTRLDKLRDDVAVFARDVVRLVAEVIAKQFTEKTLIKSSGILYEEEISQEDFENGADLQELLTPETDNQPPAGGQQGSPLGGGARPMMMPMAAGGQQGPAQQQPGQMPSTHPGVALPPGMVSPAPGIVEQAPGAGAAPGHAPGAALGSPPPGAQPPAPLGPPPLVQKVQRIKKAIELLKDDIPRGYRITIETDSTIAGEIANERDDAIQFLTAVSKYLENAQIIGAQNPAIVPLLGKLLQFGVRKFRTGRDVEAAIDDFVDKADRMAKHLQENPGAQPPSPEQIKANMEQQKMAAEIKKMELGAQLDAQNDQRKQQLDEAQAQRDMMAQQAEEQRQARLAEMKFNFERMTLQMRMQMEQRKLDMQMQMEQQRAQQEHQHEQHRMALEQQQRESEHQFQQRDMEMQSKHRAAEHEFNMRELGEKKKENDAARADRAETRKATATAAKSKSKET